MDREPLPERYIDIMDPSPSRGRSPSGTPHHHHIKNSQSPSPALNNHSNSNNNNNIGLGIDLDSSSTQPFARAAQDFNFLDAQQQAQTFASDPSFQAFNPQLDTTDDLSSFGQQQHHHQHHQHQQSDFDNNDFTIFPPTTGEQFGAPLFAGDPGLGQPLGSPDDNNMQAPYQPTPPHMLKPDPSSAHNSPSFSQTHFVPSPGHSRNVSLGPEAALLPGQDWSQFRSHRRSPSEYSDVSSVGAPSPNLGVSDSFDHDLSHSPMQRPQDHSVMQELHGIGGFTISERGRSPSHSPAISPRILPQQISDVTHQNFTLASNGYMGPPQPYGGVQGPGEAFPSLPTSTEQPQNYQFSAPTINIDYAPPPARNVFDGRSSLDTDALTPPDRGT